MSFLRKAFGFFSHAVPVEMDIEASKKSLRDLIERNDPPEFFDGISGEADLLKNPVLTDRRQLYERDSILRWLETNETCPFTQTTLKKGQWVDAGYLKETIYVFAEQKKLILTMIEKMDAKNETEIRMHVQEYLKKVAGYRKKFEEDIALGIQREIINIKNEFKLSMTSAAHLHYWNENKGCCGAGLKAVTLNDDTYYLSPRTYRVMVAANQSYKRVTDFREAINQAIASPLSSWSTFWGSTAKAAKMESFHLIREEKPVTLSP